jgi:hypothetical protein
VRNFSKYRQGKYRPAAAGVVAVVFAAGLSGCAFAPEQFDAAAAPDPGPIPVAATAAGLLERGAGARPAFAVLRADVPLPEDDETAVPLSEARRHPAPAAATKGGLVLDREPPRVQVHFVRGGRLRAHGPEILVRGTVRDASPVALVTVNGYIARLTGRGFARRVPVPMGVHRSVVQALDIHGNAALVPFDIVRRGGRDGGAPVRAGAGSLERGPGAPPPRQIRSLTDIDVPGAYMVLLAGTVAMHALPMPSLAHCQLAAGYSDGGTCTERR